MEKLNTFGIGPKIVRFVLPWLVVTIFLTLKFRPAFNFLHDGSAILLPGVIVTVAGLIFYISSLTFLLNGLKETRLITKGPFSLCSNPLYSSIILAIIPGVSLILNSWLLLTTSLAGYILFRINIGSEKREMEKFFGEAYLKYSRETPEFFPFPLKKLFKRQD